MQKKSCYFNLKVLLMAISLLLPLTACAPQGEESSVSETESQTDAAEESQEDSTEESQSGTRHKICTVDWKIDLSKVPGNWKRPSIIRYMVDPAVWNSETLWDGTRFSEEADFDLRQIFFYLENLKKDRPYDIFEPTYSFHTFVNTESEAYSSEQTPWIIPSTNTWIMNMDVSCYVRGCIMPYGESLLETEPNEWVRLRGWNYEGNKEWVLRLEDNFLYIMTYVDYVYARMTLGGDEDPFEKDWAGIHTFKGKYIYPNGSQEPPEGTYYFEPLQGYLYENATVYRYNAPTAEVSDSVVQAAALAIGHEYMQELCSKEYDPDAGMDINYKIWDYKDLKATITNRMKDVYPLVLEISNPENANYDWLSRYGTNGLARLDTIWLVEYDVTARIDGNYGAYCPQSRDEWVSSDAGFFDDRCGIMVKDGSTYYLIFKKDVVIRRLEPIE